MRWQLKQAWYMNTHRLRQNGGKWDYEVYALSSTIHIPINHLELFRHWLYSHLAWSEHDVFQLFLIFWMVGNETIKVLHNTHLINHLDLFRHWIYSHLAWNEEDVFELFLVFWMVGNETITVYALSSTIHISINRLDIFRHWINSHLAWSEQDVSELLAFWHFVNYKNWIIVTHSHSIVKVMPCTFKREHTYNRMCLKTNIRVCTITIPTTYA